MTWLWAGWLLGWIRCLPCARFGAIIMSLLGEKSASMAKEQTTGAGPKAVAMVICDMVVRDEQTKNVSLISLFNAVTGPRLPLRNDRMHVFVSLTNGHGDYDCLLQCKSPDEKVVFEARGKISLKDPLAVADLNLELRGLVFEVSGDYIFEFYCGGELLTMRRFSVIVKE